MASTALIGMRGVYVAAAELTRRGFIVSPTSRGMFGADLLVTDQRCQRAWSVQIKTTANPKPSNSCLVGKHARDTASATHIYIFVALKDDGSANFLVVPSKVVKANARRTGNERGLWVFDRKHAPKKQWKVFSDPDSARRNSN